MLPCSYRDTMIFSTLSWMHLKYNFPKLHHPCNIYNIGSLIASFTLEILVQMTSSSIRFFNHSSHNLFFFTNIYVNHVSVHAVFAIISQAHSNLSLAYPQTPGLDFSCFSVSFPASLPHLPSSPSSVPCHSPGPAPGKPKVQHKHTLGQNNDISWHMTQLPVIKLPVTDTPKNFNQMAPTLIS